MKIRISKVMALMVCVIALLSFPVATMAAQPSGDVGDSYYKFRTSSIQPGDGNWVFYNGTGVKGSSVRLFKAEITPIVPGNSTPIDAVVRVYEYGYSFSYLYFENLPYPGTQYMYSIKELNTTTDYYYERILETGSFTTTGTTPSWIANPSSGSGGTSSTTTVPTYTVNVNKPYSFIIQGEYGTPAGILCDAKDFETQVPKNGAIKATSIIGSGITLVKSVDGKEFTGEGIKQVVIGSKTIYINVVPAPVPGSITVTW